MALLTPQKVLSTMYDRLPAGVRKSIGPVLEPSYFAAKRVWSILSQLHLPVYKLEGKGRWGQGNLTTLLLGEGRGMLPYILHLLYEEKPKRAVLGKAFTGNVKSRIESYRSDVDLILIGIDEFFARFLSRQGFMVMPEWVMFKLDLTKPFPGEGRSKGLNNNLRKVRKYKYSYEITHDFAKFKDFYYRMYLPYATNKYGELSLVGGFRDLRKIFERGALLLVNRGDECIAGDLLQMDDKTISARYTGITDGKIEYLAQGALAACYYFVISWAKEKGYKWIDFGHCRPFFNDGPFMHKKTWRMEIMKSTRPMLATKAVFCMKICNHQQEVLDFLANNPFVSINEGKLKGLIFSLQDHPLSLNEIQAINKEYFIPGIDKLVITSSRGFTKESEEFTSSQSPQRLHLEGLNSNRMLGSI